MKGYRFYAEMPPERGSKSASKRYPHQPFTRAAVRELAERGARLECLAVLAGPRHDTLDALAHEPGGIALVPATADFLRKRCVRIGEDVARKLDPSLFAYLDSRPFSQPGKGA